MDYLHGVSGQVLLRPNFGVAFDKVSTVTNANNYFHMTFHVAMDRPAMAPKLRQIFCLMGKQTGVVDGDDKFVSERRLCRVFENLATTYYNLMPALHEQILQNQNKLERVLSPQLRFDMLVKQTSNSRIR